MIKKFYVTVNRDGIQSNVYWIHAISVLQGMSYGLCSIPDSTNCWDVEYFKDTAILTIECTKEHFDNFIKNIGGLFPISYSYKEES